MGSEYYVAPPEPPPSRRPPLTSVGPLGWMRANLFSSPLNSLATIITLGLMLWFLGGFISWSIRQAQWNVIVNNLRLITSGLYDRQEIWRVELTAAILVFLTGLGLGIWGHVARSVFLVALFALAVILIIPLLGAGIPEPSIYVLIEPERTPTDFVFTGLKGDEVSFAIDPLTDVGDMRRSPAGYIESGSRTEWSTQAREVITGNLDLTEYNLLITARLLDHTKTLVSGAQFTVGPEPSTNSFSITLPRDGWYILEVRRNDENEQDNAGYAWLKIDGVQLFSGQDAAAATRLDEFGAVPDVERPLFAEGNIYRFEGTQGFDEFINLQVAPFFNNIAFEFVAGIGLFGNAWLIGMLGKRERVIRRAAISGWILATPVILIILHGFQGSRLLPQVGTNVWGGLLLTMLLTVVGITASFPLGVALALGRRSELPAIKWTCTLFIEVVRGVPLITILFMAKLIVPFFWSALSDIDLTIRMMIGLTLFSAAYLAENVRGGLQIVPHGQIEAARALGMNPMLTTSFIVLPQALRAVIPAIVGQFISLFKDTSLVAIVGVYELVGIVDTIVSGQPVYRPYQREAYIFIAIVYFVISYAMSDVSRRLETSGAGSIRK